MGSDTARSRLDRFLVSYIGSGWTDKVTQQTVFKFPCDHLPILLSSEMFSYSPKPFKLFNVWSDYLDLQSLVKEECKAEREVPRSF